ncbi:MAG: DUF368 domain-containing protein [Longimicrobiales bacterium]
MLTWLSHTVRGACMGIADAIPGVSGGTMALILGIYPRLIDAVGSLGPTTVRRVFSGAFWRRALTGATDPEALGEGPVDLEVRRVLFLAFLGVGMAAAIIVGSRVIPSLLDRYPAQMRGFFFGLVLCSVSVPLRMIHERRWTDYTTLLVAGVLTWLLLAGSARTDLNARGSVDLVLAEAPATEVVLDPARFFVSSPGPNGGPDVVFGPLAPVRIEAEQTRVTVPLVARMAGEWGNLPSGSIREVRGAPEGATVIQTSPTAGGRNPSTAVLFSAGFVAISAMVLPGISGSFILLLFGLYHYVTHSLRMALFEGDPTAVSTVVTVLIAIVAGLLTITRVIKLMLARYQRLTLAALSGLMIGSLRMLWPFTRVAADGRVRNVVPESLDHGVLMVTLTFLVGAVAVLLLERVASAGSTTESAVHS